MTTAPLSRTERPLKGADPVAALLLAMGKPLAGRMMARLEEDEIRLVTRAIADLKPVSAHQLEAIIEDFATGMVEGPHVVGDAGLVAELLEGILPPEQVSAIIGEMAGRTNQSIWDRVSNVSETNLTAYIMREHPQTAAVILSRLRPPASAKVMQQLPESFRNQDRFKTLQVAFGRFTEQQIIEAVPLRNFCSGLLQAGRHRGGILSPSSTKPAFQFPGVRGGEKDADQASVQGRIVFGRLPDVFRTLHIDVQQNVFSLAEFFQNLGFECAVPVSVDRGVFQKSSGVQTGFKIVLFQEIIIPAIDFSGTGFACGAGDGAAHFRMAG